MRFWQLRNEIWHLPEKGAIMGILNVTPDSFSDGGAYNTLEKAMQRAEQMINEGADIIDVGGESTRPGSIPVAIEEELQRTIPIIRALRARFPSTRISIDTRHSEVAKQALQAGADIVNDIEGLGNPTMRKVCAEHPCGIILMHMQGSPATMQENPDYRNVVEEVRSFFENRLKLATSEGISADRICLDPGIGFGKTCEHNLVLIRHLSALRVQELPLMMALSRKRFMGELLNDPCAAKESPLPTVALSLLSAENGADLHRVHDVAPLFQALTLRQAVKGTE